MEAGTVEGHRKGKKGRGLRPMGGVEEKKGKEGGSRMEGRGGSWRGKEGLLCRNHSLSDGIYSSLAPPCPQRVIMSLSDVILLF